MTDTVEDRIARVRRVVDAARIVATDPSLIDPIAASTGLSREGVELGLRDHLETNPSDEELLLLVQRAVPAAHVHVILSANVFTAPLRAIAYATASSPSVSVQTSSREPHFANALLRAIADPAIFAADRDYPRTLSSGEVHVYGRSATIDAVEKLAQAGLVIRKHGPGFGVACVLPADDLARASVGLASDIVPFDQRGCVSPRIVFVVGDSDRVNAFADLLAAALDRANDLIPRGALSEDEKTDAVRYVETTRFAGRVSVGASYAVGVSTSIMIPPSGRHAHVVRIPSLTEITHLLAPVAHLVTAVCPNEREIASFFPASVRLSAFGMMQRPPLDGPVDLRRI